MSKSLNVAEKPSVAKKIIKILNHKNKIQEKLSWSNFNKVVEFTYKGKIMIFTSIIGHLIDLDFSKRKKKWDAVNPMDLFKIPLEKQISKGKYGLYKNLKFYAQKCDELILWLDCDREGENIAFEVIQICQETRPQIHCLRAKFNSLIAHQIYKAINNLTIPNKNHSDAVWIRREIDLRIGAAFTRFQTMYLQKSFKVKTVSYGPCQFPTLGFIVEQWRRSQNFQAEKFWFIRVELQYIINKDVFKSKKIQNCTFCWHRQYLFDKIPVLALYELCLLNPIAIVISIVSQSKEKMKPFPLETIEFTKHATHYLKMSSKQAMDAAEKLYQFGYISYPRTETNVFPDDFDHQQFIITQKKNPINQISISAKKLIEGKYKPPRNGGKKDKGHLPIHPIGIPKNLQFDSYEERVYEYIVRHYLASISDNAKGEEISIFINISSEKFFTKGTYISALNWLEIYHWEKWNDKQIPDLLVNQTFQPSNITFNEGLTSSPKCLTETELITKMTKNGIGTDATTPTHIETILLRNYARKDKESRFRPQPLGIGLCLGYENMINTYGKYLSKPILRRDMEKAIVKISQGRKDKDIFLNECLTKIRMVK